MTAGIESGLKSRGFHTTTKKGELRYPAGGFCDLIVNPDTSDAVWIECKTAYRQHLAESIPGSQYRYNYDGADCYDPGRGKNSWVQGVRDIREAVRKLLTLRPTDAEYVGVLLLGFDKETSPLMNDDLDELLPQCLDQWNSAHGGKDGVTWNDSYPVRRERGFRERVWFWYRPIATDEQVPAT